jgi:hypothetical protein
MHRQPWILIITLLPFILIGCNQAIINNAVPTLIMETPAPVISTPISNPQVTITPKTSDTTPELMVAPLDVKTETLPAGIFQDTAPEGFRKLLVYPIGGIEGLTSCEPNLGPPYFQNAPTEFQAFAEDTWGENRIATCGWGKGETVKITVTKPDGSQELSTQTFEDDITISYYPNMEYGMQLGKYFIAFESPSGQLFSTFNIVKPSIPGLIETDENKYYIYGFQPGEHAYILAYIKSDDELQMSTWRETTMDDRGELLLDDQFGDDLLAVVGDSSGAVMNNTLLRIFIGENMYYKQVDYCEGAPVSRLQPFSFAVATEGSPNNVRSKPSNSADLVGTIDPGTVVVIGKRDPVCADGFLWWQVEPRGAPEPHGWTVEGKGSDYWLAPLE